MNKNRVVRFIMLTLVAAGGVVWLLFEQPTSAQNNLHFIPNLRNPRPFIVQTPSGTFPNVTAITNAGDNRLFVNELQGRTHVRQVNGTVSTFLDISDRVDATSGELGMYDIAFAPDTATSRSFYVSYTGRPMGDDQLYLVVSRFDVSADPNVADPTSETILFALQQNEDTHQGGSLALHPLTGDLYLSVGDDRRREAAALPDNFYGKIVAFDADDLASLESVTPSTQLLTPTIAALGFRNPWRIAFDERTGDLFIGDVGKITWEEVNLLPNSSPPLNFGWPCYEAEAFHLPETCDETIDYTFPIHFYFHGNGRCSISGGEVIHDETSPYDGGFIYADFCTGEIFIVRPNGAGWRAEKLGEATRPLIATFGLDSEYNVYGGFMTYGGSPKQLDRYRLPR